MRSGVLRHAAIVLSSVVLVAAIVGTVSWHRVDDLGTPAQTRSQPGVYETGPGFSSDTPTASRFGTHEISISGNVAATNPFDVELTVRFVPPSGSSGAKTVLAFFDGGSTWKARVYTNEVGVWTWSSHCRSEAAIDGRSGSFESRSSTLPGLLGRSPNNPRSWATADGRSFVHISDTAYKLLHDSDSPLWRKYIQDAAAQGITALRAGSLGAFDDTVTTHDNWTHNDPWIGGRNPDYARFDLAKFQATDERLIWVLNHHPRIAIQMILFGLKGYGVDNTGASWFAIPEVDRKRTMSYMIARWGAFPNLYWLIVNDMHSGPDFPQNRAFAREVGRFFATHEPWPHLMSTGPNRYAGFPFAGPEDRDWCTYAHLEDMDAVGADIMTSRGLASVPMHVFMAEDRYEQDYDRYKDPDYFFRWLFWSWALAGGSANYGGRFGVIHPYTQTGLPDLSWTGLGGTDFTGERLHGLDAGRFIASFFASRSIDLSTLIPSDGLVTDASGRGGKLRPKAALFGSREIVVYHPNAIATGLGAAPDSGQAAAFRIDLTAFQRKSFRVEWFRASDGVTAAGPVILGGGTVLLTAPWTGVDAVARLTARNLGGSGR